MTKVRHVLGISGGKDSAALAIYMKQKYPTLEVEYYNSDTGCELEETEKLVNNLESFLGKIERLKAAEGSPEPTPFDHFLKISGGYLPSPQARWCTNKMKLAEFEKFVGDEPTVSYVGIRGDEDREGYVSTKPNIQAVFPFRRNIWSLDVIHKALHNDNLDIITELYKEWASDNIKEEAVEIASTPINKSFYYSRKLNALLDLSVKTFNRIVYEFLKTTDLNAHEIGKVVLKEGELIVNFAQARPKTKEEAKLETHNNFIDIQIPLSGVETMGYTPRTDLPEEEYNAEKDITFYKGFAKDYLTITPGMFAIFFPQDGHAPGVTPDGVKKVIVKVRAY